MYDKREELEELEKKRKQLLKEIKEQEQQHYKALVEFFGDDFPRNEKKRPISLKQFKDKYELVEKRGESLGMLDQKENSKIEIAEQFLKIMNTLAPKIASNNGFVNYREAGEELLALKRLSEKEKK